MTRRILFGLLLATFALGVPSARAAPDPDAQRQAYTEALAALEAGDEARYRELYRQLDGYVLQGYARYAWLEDRIEQASAAVMREFLNEYGHTPLPRALRERWLHVLAARGDWDTFVREYGDDNGDAELACLYLARRLEAGERTAAIMGRIEELWTTGRRLPAPCNPVFAGWREAGHMATEKVWERIRLAMQAGSLTLARELAAFYLPAEEGVWVERWQAMHRHPARELAALDYRVETPVARLIVRHGVVRLAYRDPEEAMRRWQQLKQRHEFFGEDEDYVLRYIAILAAQERSPHALEWLSAVSAQPDDLSLKRWRVYAALWAREWEAARRFIADLPEEESHTTGWRYWNARMLEHEGHAAAAHAIYGQLARERDYYGFLAADRIGVEYSMQHHAIEVAPAERADLLARPAVQAARELYTLGYTVEARRQWHWAIRDLNNRQLQVAAVIARAWGWHDRAIYTVNLSGHPDDLELRFPVIYRDVIEANAARYDIDPGWVYGVVRQESAFMVDARSPSGALGLMQLLPSTGRALWRRLGFDGRVRDALLSVEHNVRLGVGYLNQVLQRYDGHQVLATASYNAGPNRVSRWIPAEPLAADVWVETIPYSETRAYVKNVLAFAAVYEYRLGTGPTRLSARMPVIEP